MRCLACLTLQKIAGPGIIGLWLRDHRLDG
jgi:hypothetical protein